MDSIAETLLSNIPRGEVIKDPREQDYPEATIQGAELVQNSTGSWAVILEWGNLVDTDGRAFPFKERYNIPESDSDPVQKRIFLSNLHDIGLISRDDKRAVHADTDEQREALLVAFQSLTGNVANLRLQESKQGYMQSRVLRAKK